MMFSSNGLIGSNNNDSTAGDPRIVELPSSSPYSGSLDSVLQSGSNNGTIINSGLAQPIITTPETEALSLMPPPPVPVRRTQQQTSDDAMALLSSLGSSATSSSSSAQGAGAANNTSNRSSRAAVTRPRSASGSGSGLAPLPSTLASTSQSLQPLTRATNGARGNVAAFLTKSYNMVSEPGSNNLIKWSDDGQSFVVVNHVEFAKEVLPKFFKHNNFSSFVRQLNMYGFHKVPHLQQGVLMPNSDSEQWEFSNPHFQRNQPDLLNLVSRKKASNNSDDKDSLTMDLDHIMHEVAAIKRHQVAISTDLKNIERDHQSLWQESVAARERHQRQQETIDKILRFLASVFSGDKTRAIIPNKKARLTITDGEVDGSSSADAGRQLVEEEEEEEEEDGRNDILAGGKRKRPSATATTTNDGRQRANYPTLDSTSAPILASLKQAALQNQVSTPTTAPTTSTTTTTPNRPVVPTVSAATSNLSFPDYLTTLPNFDYSSLSGNNNALSSALPGGLQFDPSNLTIPTGLLPNALTPIHHDMLRSISMANAQDTIQNPPPLAPLPPSLSHTSAGASVIKGADQITQEVDQLERSIKALSQYGLIADHFDFDDDAYLSLADSYDSNGFGHLGDPYQNVLAENPSTAILPASSASAVPTSLTLATNTNLGSSSVGTHPRISTEDDLEDLLDMDPV